MPSPLKGGGEDDTAVGGDGDGKTKGEAVWTVVSTGYNGAEDQKVQGPVERLRFPLY